MRVILQINDQEIVYEIPDSHLVQLEEDLISLHDAVYVEEEE